MHIRLEEFIKSIKDKTGVSVAVYSETGEYLWGETDRAARVFSIGDEIVVDEENDRTLFPLHGKGKKYIGVVGGSDKTSYNYACFISELSEGYSFKENDYNKADFYRAAIYGEVNMLSIRRYVKKFSIPEMPCCCMIIESERVLSDDLKSIVLGYGENKHDFFVQTAENTGVLIKFCDDGYKDYRSSTEYAEYLSQFIAEETGVEPFIAIGGTIPSVSGLSRSYSQALSALRIAKTLSSAGRIHSYKEYVPVKLLEELPRYKLNEIIEILTDGKSSPVFDDAEISETAETFMENNLNVSETSRKMFLHRNTLSYRLDKIKQSTGLDIRKFSDACVYNMITVINKLNK